MIFVNGKIRTYAGEPTWFQVMHDNHSSTSTWGPRRLKKPQLERVIVELKWIYNVLLSNTRSYSQKTRWSCTWPSWIVGFEPTRANSHDFWSCPITTPEHPHEGQWDWKITTAINKRKFLTALQNGLTSSSRISCY